VKNERVFSNGRHQYILAESSSGTSNATFEVWFISSMGKERYPRPSLAAAAVESTIEAWRRQGYKEVSPTAPIAAGGVLHVTDKQFAWLLREITAWRRQLFDRVGEMSEPGDYDFEIRFQARFGHSFAEWEATLHARGYDQHPPIRPALSAEAVARMWSELEAL
jgi:hypothetical protein